MRQQRRRNAPTVATTFAPYPQVYDNWILAASGLSKVLLTSAFPLATPGVPSLLLNDIDLPVSITRPNDNEIEFTYPNPIGLDAVLRLPPWDPNVRGLNGEWLAPKASTVNSSVPTTQVIWIVSSNVTGANTSTIFFSENVAILSLPNWQLDDGNTMTAAVAGFAADQVDVTWLLPVSGFANYLLVPQGETEIRGVSGFFVAPASVFVQ